MRRLRLMVGEEGCKPTFDGWFVPLEDSYDVSPSMQAQNEALASQNARLLRERNDAYKTMENLRELNRKMALELQQSETRYKELSNELATVNRIRVNCEEKIRKIDEIISPF